MIEHQEDPLSNSQNDSEEYEILDPIYQQLVPCSISISEYLATLNISTAQVAIQTNSQQSQSQQVLLFQRKQNQQGKLADSNSKIWATIGFQKRYSKNEEITKLKQQIAQLSEKLTKKENQCQQLYAIIKKLQIREQADNMRVTALQMHLNTYGNQNTKIDEIKQEVIKFYQRELQEAFKLMQCYKNHLFNIIIVLNQNKIKVQDENQVLSALTAHFANQSAIKKQINKGLKEILLICCKDKALKKNHDNPQDFIKDIKKNVEVKFAQMNELSKSLRSSAQRIKQLQSTTKNPSKF